jgi:hypothetical protein
MTTRDNEPRSYEDDRLLDGERPLDSDRRADDDRLLDASRGGLGDNQRMDDNQPLDDTRLVNDDRPVDANRGPEDDRPLDADRGLDDDRPLDDADRTADVDRSGDSAEQTTQGLSADDPLVPTETAVDFKARWDVIQQGFVDDPRNSVTDADKLVGDVLQRLSTSFDQQHQGLESQWANGEPSTEDLRAALQRYRAFFERLLTL